jgi:hypothetical protein
LTNRGEIDWGSCVGDRFVNPIGLANTSGSLFPIRSGLYDMQSAVIAPLIGGCRINPNLVLLVYNTFIPTGIGYVGEDYKQ